MSDYKNNFPNKIIVQPRDEDDFDFKQIVGALLRFWPLFTGSVVAALVVAFLFLRYSTPSYKINAKILVKDDKKGGGINGSEVFADMGLLTGPSSVDNEVEVLKSRTLMEKTVDALQLNARYFAEGSVKQTELFYEKLPFELSLVGIEDDSLKLGKVFTFTNINQLQFILNDEISSKKVNYNDTLFFPFGKMVFKRKPLSPAAAGKPFIIKISKKDNVVEAFQMALSVATTSKTVSTIDLALQDAVPERGEKLINTLISIYNSLNTEDKNRIADSTISFVDNRLVYVTAELGDVEKEIESFKRKNKLTDLSAQGQLLLQNSSEGMKNIAQQQVQIDIINSLEKYLRNDQNNLKTIPAGLAVPDPTFAALIQSYNLAVLEKERQLQTTTENNPVVQTLNVQISSLKDNILANLATIGRTMQISLSQLQKGSNSFESKIEQVPQKERTFLEFSRQQSIKQELYLYLLRKREETAVSKAANIDNARVVDAAKSETQPFSPRRKLVYLFSVLLGLIFPALLLYLKHLISNKIQDKKDIARGTSAPIIGEIGRSLNSKILITASDLRQPIAEQFRLLRTNLEFMLAGNHKSKSIMITSAMSGEGKSFLSLNLATILALTNKKVVIIEFDLRKPKLSKYLEMSNNEGLSNFLINKNNDINSLIKLVPGYKNLYLFGSGIIPPNPAELISSEQTNKLFVELEEMFDFIVIDVPPVGVVADALLLAKYANVTLYVVRQAYTFKKQLEIIEELHTQKKLSNLGIVFNDLKKEKSYGYGYGYSYGEYERK